LAEKGDPLRYTLKLLELRQIKSAITATAALYDGSQLFVVAQKLREMGHLQEAIALAEKETWYGSGDLDRVAEAVITHRPEWVIRISLKKADDLIAPTQSKLYPDAARWLSRAKRAYLHKNQSAEWQAYISDLRSAYARRPSLQKALAGL
jgi:uncharacterized Zn finger protein